MSITPELRQMLGLKAACAIAALARQFHVNPDWKRIDAAKCRIDGAWNGQGWKPSELLTIGYCVLKTGRNPSSAGEFLDQALGQGATK